MQAKIRQLLISPSTDDYLYMIDFRTDFYYIAPQALERFCIGENAFHNVMENHKEFVYRPDYPLCEDICRKIKYRK